MKINNKFAVTIWVFLRMPKGPMHPYSGIYLFKATDFISELDPHVWLWTGISVSVPDVRLGTKYGCIGPEASLGAIKCFMVSEVQPQILNPIWTLTYGFEQVYLLPYCNFSPGCEVYHWIWMHWTLKYPQEHVYALWCHTLSHRI